MKNWTLEYWQKRIIILCWLAYTVAYLGRINLSIAIPVMEKSLVFNKINLGIIGSIFFWVYAFGQLINGRLGDKYDARRFVFIGLFFSALLNILFGFSTSLIVMVILWALNGYFQSMLWGPLMKTINQWFLKEQKSRISLFMFSSALTGYLITWGILGKFLLSNGWEKVFLIPGKILLIYSFIWYLYVRNNPEEVELCLKYIENHHADGQANIDRASKNMELNQPDSSKDTALSTSLIELMLHTRLYLIIFATISLGFVREGISLWAPTMLAEIFNLNIKLTTNVALFIPLFNFFGVIAVRLFIDKLQDKETTLSLIFFIIGIISCILLFFFKNTSIFIYLSLLAICSSCLYGASSVIVSVIPMKYSMTSSVAGLLDFSIYLGAGLSGIITGFVSNNYGWNIVLLVWGLIGIVGCTIMFIASRNNPPKI